MDGEKMKSNFFKRVGAYLLDSFIVIFILSLVTVGFKSDSKLIDEANDLLNSYANQEITISEYNDKVMSINYELQKENVWVNGISCALYIGYFILFAYFNNGQTIGKKIFKIRVVDKNNNKIKFSQIFVRSIFIYGIISSFYSAIFINFLGVSTFNMVGSIISYIEYTFIIVCFFMVLYKKDKRGLHDIISGTMISNDIRK